jgi:lipoprotein-anchoring transpeptidase ErfK/SrfK
VQYPGSAVVAGTVLVPYAPVTLLSRASGAEDWAALGSVVSSAAGTFAFTVTPAATTEYRVQYAGDTTHPPASAEFRVEVRPRVTTTFPVSLWLGETKRLKGAVAPAHPGATVLIERRRDGEWVPYATATLDADSRFSLPWKPSEFGYHRLRARLEAHDDHADGVSADKLVIVNRPNRHRVPYKYKHFIVIVVHEYKLYYYERGKLVRGFRVALGKPGYPTPIGRYHITWKRRPAGGALGSCAMYYKGSIAIHGTNEPWLLTRFPRNFSHGCARMYNKEALWLYYRCPKGTPVRNMR